MKQSISPGFLHFDVRRGLCADMLAASLVEIVPDMNCVQEAFNLLGLPEITFVVGESAAFGISCRLISFYLGSEKIDRQISLQSGAMQKKRHSLFSMPIWDQRKKRSQTKVPRVLQKRSHPLLEACLSNDSVPLCDVEKFFLEHDKSPRLSALALKTIRILSCSHSIEHRVNGQEVLWLLCQLITLCAQIESLDPKFISASVLRTTTQTGVSDKNKTVLSLSDDHLIQSILQNIPIIETEETIAIDALGVAFIKAVCGHFGARGQCTNLHKGAGTSLQKNPQLQGVVEALWCEAHLPSSMQELGSQNHARMQSVHRVSGIVAAQCDVVKLCKSLSLHGATSLLWSLVHGEENQTWYKVEFLCADSVKHEVLEAFLVKGNAEKVSSHIVELHDLNQRVVCVPLGSGNKTSSARFIEYLYYSSTVRVEPVAEDLDAYVQKTDYSVDVARADLLMAWKKWRSRIALEHT